MIKEFKDETNKRINIYQADSFLELASKNLNEALNEEAVDEIRKVRLADELAIEKEIAMLFEDNGVDTLEAKQIAREMTVKKESAFEKAIRTSIEENEKKP